jgi:hypothetical protein
MCADEHALRLTKGKVADVVAGVEHLQLEHVESGPRGA